MGGQASKIRNPLTGDQGGSLGNADVLGNALDKVGVWQNIANGKGGSLGRWDALGNALDKVKGNPLAANKDFSDPNAIDYGKAPTLDGTMPGEGAGGLKSWLGGGAGGLDPNAYMDPQITRNDASSRNGGQMLDTSALNNLSNYASSTSDSPWLALTKQKIQGQERGLRQQGALDAYAGSNQAMNAAATHGGLSGGAAARIAGRAGESAANSMQNASKWGSQGALDAGIFEQGDKMSTMRALPGMDLAAANYNLGKDQGFDAVANQAKGMNISNFIGGNQQQNQNVLAKYSEDMKKYVGDVTADATAKSGKRK